MKSYIQTEVVIDMLEDVSEQLKGLEEQIGYAVATERKSIFQEKADVFLQLQQACEAFDQNVTFNVSRELSSRSPGLTLSLQPKYSY